MLIVSKKSDLMDVVRQYREQNNESVGFVPTMGFLHPGHASLVQKSIEENGLTICDIFVNPLQFNEKSDFVNYPVNLEADTSLLQNIGCDVLYLPPKNDLYPPGHVPITYSFGHLESVMEGKHRPGHFQGVAEVVRILLEIVQPDKAYFGEKDFQQLMIIQAMVKQFGFPVEIIPCPVIRESDGLAMSSRNARLSEKERNAAPFIFEQLMWCKQNHTCFSPKQLKNHVENAFRQHPLFQLEYVEFAGRNKLNIIDEWPDAEQAGVFIAARLGSVRLIDNMILF